MFKDRADIALIGGSARDRVAVACQMRRQGVKVFHELADSKRAKMHKRAASEVRGGSSRVFDISDPVDLAVARAVASMVSIDD